MVKVERSYPAPESLVQEAVKAKGDYAKADVIRRLAHDFHDKCYICEMKRLADPQVEHLHPHHNRAIQERVFDWDNLFWVCSHCNNVKNQKKYEDKIIDCCKNDPESAIRFSLIEDDVKVTAKDPADEEAVATAELVTEVFNLQNTGLRERKSAVRLRYLQVEMNVLYKKLIEFKQNPASRVLFQTLTALLRRESRFAGFKRCFVRMHLNEFPLLRKAVE